MGPLMILFLKCKIHSPRKCMELNENKKQTLTINEKIKNLKYKINN